jgi:hypothetical protein
MGGAVRVSINTQLVRIELVISVAREHGTKLTAPATHPVTQVDHTAVNVIVWKRMNTDVTIFCMYVYSDLKETNPFFFSTG